MEIEGFSINDGNVETFKKKKTKKGGFHDFGLSPQVTGGILKRGYKIPTPIQKKTIPLALEGRDVVAMARTGSGKTACFVIPLLDKLKKQSSKTGARALILSPTRELALQTLKFIRELGKFTDLKSIVILGGDSMDEQFSALHDNPDIIVTTPGRFLHICVEMNLSLKSIEYVVFDEADRLFEMGFGDQIQEITNRLPEQRQTLLFSATLPKVLVDFAKAGLGDPVLVRLDVETKLPEQLKLVFLTCRPEEKVPVLLCLLKNMPKPNMQTIIFAATMRDVEYIHQILNKANITSTFIYSNLDPEARKINAAKFQNKRVNVLVVTDVAARGIDIPHLDCVINFNFPAKGKLFIHRVGRCARAGRSGTAYNIVSPDEYAYLLDLYLFLGRSLSLVPVNATENIPDDAVGKMPQSMVEEELAEINNWHANSNDFDTMRNDCQRSYDKYIRTRPLASSESVKRAKDINFNNVGIMQEFRDNNTVTVDIVAQMKKYRPPGTIFEILGKKKTTDYEVMKAKRAYHKESIGKFHRLKEEREMEESKCKSNLPVSSLPSSNADDVKAAFSEVIQPKKRKVDDLYREKKKKRKLDVRDDEFYIPYSAPDKHTEEGLAVHSFANDADRNQIDLLADDDKARRLQMNMKRWDRKKKKMVQQNEDGKNKKIRTESGVWIPASYQSGRYKQWKEKSKIDSQNNFDDDLDEGRKEQTQLNKLKTTGHTHWARHNRKVKEKEMNKIKSELKRPEEIVKKRKLMEKKKARMQGKGKGKGKGRKSHKGKKH